MREDSSYRPLTGAVDSASYNSSTNVSSLNGKTEPLMTVTSIPDVDVRATTWNRSWKRLAPLSGLFSLLIGLSSTFASFAILYASNGAATSSWTYQPSAYLAVVTAVANQAIRYAAFQGAVISWWRRALKGTTISSLHYNWAIAATPWKSLLSPRSINWMLLPCLASIIVAIDGPILQRASTVVSAQIQSSPVNLQVAISPQIPRGYSGYYEYSQIPESWTVSTGISNDYMIAVGQHVTKAQQGWTSSASSAGLIEGCPGKTCKAKIRAPALDITSCTQSTYESNFLGLSPREKFVKTENDPPVENIAFMVNIGMLVREQELINLTVVYAQPSTADCKGNITARTCLLHSAIGLYDITIDDNMVTLDSPSTPEILMASNNTLFTSGAIWPTHNVQGYNKSTLAGVAGLGVERYVSYAFYLTPHPDASKKRQNVQAFFEANQWFASTFLSPGDLSTGDAYAVCGSYADPTSTIRAGLNDLMFRMGVDAAKFNYSAVKTTLDPGLTTSQNVTGAQGGSHNIYRTNFWYFLGASLLEFCCMGLILPLYWGWWRLGRPVSFSPLEIAKVRQFQSSIPSPTAC